jgi:Asp-tRNA(Asn)/Glu-tRNA(Gln) amidotransferase A subunit family amidase
VRASCTSPARLQTCLRYEILNASAPGASSLSVGVLSRLYFPKTFARPLEGLRVSVKDVLHLKGTYTGAGNRAYRSLYPAFTSTSAAVQRAIELGAIVVGKAKTAEFAGSQEVIWDWCDYSYALNARAYGYLASMGSSTGTGSASGLAAYPWLDMPIGSDGKQSLNLRTCLTMLIAAAGGSIRDPSVVHGIFGFRPTHDGSPTNDAVIPLP